MSCTFWKSSIPWDPKDQRGANWPIDCLLPVVLVDLLLLLLRELESRVLGQLLLQVMEFLVGLEIEILHLDWVLELVVVHIAGLELMQILMDLRGLPSCEALPGYQILVSPDLDLSSGGKRWTG